MVQNALAHTCKIGTYDAHGAHSACLATYAYSVGDVSEDAGAAHSGGAGG